MRSLCPKITQNFLSKPSAYQMVLTKDHRVCKSKKEYFDIIENMGNALPRRVSLSQATSVTKDFLGRYSGIKREALLPAELSKVYDLYKIEKSHVQEHEKDENPTHGINSSSFSVNHFSENSYPVTLSENSDVSAYVLSRMKGHADMSDDVSGHVVPAEAVKDMLKELVCLRLAFELGIDGCPSLTSKKPFFLYRGASYLPDRLSELKGLTNLPLFLTVPASFSDKKQNAEGFLNRSSNLIKTQCLIEAEILSVDKSIKNIQINSAYPESEFVVRQGTQVLIKGIEEGDLTVMKIRIGQKTPKPKVK
jgi:hypothetical protein